MLDPLTVAPAGEPVEGPAEAVRIIEGEVDRVHSIDLVAVVAQQAGYLIDCDTIEQRMIETRKADETLNRINLRATVAAYCLVDEDGKRLVSDKDIPALAQKGAIPLDEVYDIGARLSGLREADEAELVKNSEGDPSDGSGSASPKS